MAIQVQLRDDGPYVIRGSDIEVLDADGNALPLRGQCRCALPLRPVRQQAVLRRHAPPGRLRERPPRRVVLTPAPGRQA